MNPRPRERKKNFLPTLTATAILWGTTIGIIVFVDPDLPFALIVFLSSIFLTSFFTLSLVFANKIIGGVGSLLVTAFCALRFFGITNPGLPVLLLGIFLVALHFAKTRS